MKRILIALSLIVTFNAVAQDFVTRTTSCMAVSIAAMQAYHIQDSTLIAQYVPTWSVMTGKPTFATVATTGNYSDLTNKPTISVDYYNTATTTSGVATFYLTSDKTSAGAALYTTITNVIPLVNDAASNYTYGWSYNSSTKALSVTTKVSSQNVVALVGLTLLGIPANVANGTSVQVFVKGN